MFKRGNIIAFGDREYIVVDDYGPCGKVIEYSQDGGVYEAFYWESQGERAILVSRGRASYVRTINFLALLATLTIFIWLLVIVMQVS